MVQLAPDHLALAGTGREAAREEQPLVPEGTDRRGRGAGAPERREERAHRLLHALVGVEHDPARGIGDEPDRQLHLELATARLGPQAAQEAGLEHVQLGLAHRALQAQQQAVVEVGRVVEPVLVADERVGEGADLEQAMPVGGAAGEAADLQAEHDPDLAQARPRRRGAGNPRGRCRRPSDRGRSR